MTCRQPSPSHGVLGSGERRTCLFASALRQCLGRKLCGQPLRRVATPGRQPGVPQSLLHNMSALCHSLRHVQDANKLLNSTMPSALCAQAEQEWLDTGARLNYEPQRGEQVPPPPPSPCQHQPLLDRLLRGCAPEAQQPAEGVRQPLGTADEDSLGILLSVAEAHLAGAAACPAPALAGPEDSLLGGVPGWENSLDAFAGGWFARPSSAAGPWLSSKTWVTNFV